LNLKLLDERENGDRIARFAESDSAVLYWKRATLSLDTNKSLNKPDVLNM